MSKTWIDHPLKHALSEHPLGVNMLKGPKHLWYLQESTFIMFFITLKASVLEITFFMEIWNLKGVC